MPERLRHIYSDQVPSKSALSHAVRVGDLVFVSGQVGLRLGESKRPDTLAEEINVALDSLELVLHESDSSMNSVIRTTCYLRHIQDMAAFTAIYEKRFSEPRPARTTVQASLLGDLRFEIDAIAFAPRE